MAKLLTVPAVGLALLILTSCNGMEELDIGTSTHLFKTNDYSIEVPLGYTHSGPAPSGTYSFFGYPDTTETGLRGIELYDNEYNCFLTAGASQMISLPTANARTEWGRMDFFELRGWDYLPEEAPKCRPPGGGFSHVLCSKINEKSILVCVIQKTDNADLARQIFETFRWTD